MLIVDLPVGGASHSATIHHKIAPQRGRTSTPIFKYWRRFKLIETLSHGDRPFYVSHRRIGLVVLGLTLVAQGQQARVSIASIESLIRSHEYDRALQLTKSATLQTPRDFRLWTLEGIVFSIKGEDRDALSAFDKALSLSPDYIAALKGEVQLLYRTQDKRAIPLLERVLKADPKDETAHEMLATLETKQGNCQAAIDHFLLSTEAIANHSYSLEAYGYCLVQTNQPEKAVPVFEQLTPVDSNGNLSEVRSGGPAGRDETE